ncbi:hypothetical protein LIER_16614 [Lithospermum erythrorhizon]|uniref:Endonuclease/exonuclease/phosphatase domain-containing protein n=1 Tax=Lithospermum erythrorhizon TaxID=34254 RepID=A0AAV3Q9Y8_LITER
MLLAVKGKMEVVAKPGYVRRRHYRRVYNPKAAQPLQSPRPADCVASPSAPIPENSDDVEKFPRPILHKGGALKKWIQKLYQKNNDGAAVMQTQNPFASLSSDPVIEDQLEVNVVSSSLAGASLPRDEWGNLNIDDLSSGQADVVEPKLIEEATVIAGVLLSRDEGEHIQGGSLHGPDADQRGEVVRSTNHRQHVHLQVVHNITLKPFFLTVVYASCNVAERQNLWADIRSYAQNSTSWIVMGDFNALVSGDERIGFNAPDAMSMTDFTQCLLDCNLLDAGFVRSKFTRTNGRVSQRVDRVVCNYSCIDRYSSLNIRHLAKTGSDHFPLLVEFQMTQGAPRGSFRFQNTWLKNDSLFDVVEKSWSVPVFGDPFFVLITKLGALTLCLKKWNREVFGNVFTMVESVEEKVMICEGIFETSGLAVDKALVADSVVRYFQSAFQNNTAAPVEGDLIDFIPSIITAEDNGFLLALPMMEQLKEVVFSMDKNSVYRAVCNFFSGAELLRWLTSTVLSLIPKCDEARTWSNFLPISLYNFANKIITKLLNSRLSTLLPKIISEYQTGPGVSSQGTSSASGS